MGCVYLARCKVNGKLYVVKKTYDFEYYLRRYEIIAASGEPTTRVFIKALRKYGFATFEWTILAEDDDNEWLCLMEQKWIKLLGTKVPNGYNHTDGGEGTLGIERSEETRQKMREANKRQFSIEGARERHSENTKRYFREHPEARERIGL
jgi:group I intron endonuclease